MLANLKVNELKGCLGGVLRYLSDLDLDNNRQEPEAIS